MVNTRYFSLKLHSLIASIKFFILCFQEFVVRIIRNALYENGSAHVLYVDMSKYEFDQIAKKSRKIEYLLDHEINKTVFQNENIHVWTQRAPQYAPDQRPMVCFRDQHGTRIYIVNRTFDRLMHRVNSVQKAYDRFYAGDYDYLSSDSDSDDDSYDEDDSYYDENDEYYYDEDSEYYYDEDDDYYYDEDDEYYYDEDDDEYYYAEDDYYYDEDDEDKDIYYDANDWTDDYDYYYHYF